MNYLKKAVTAFGSTCVAALLVAALAPKATHGIVAALVQVTNTSSNPVSTLDADHATQIPYQDYETFSAPPLGFGVFPVVVTFAQVPAGYRLVVQNVNTGFAVESGNPVPNACMGSNFSPGKFFPCVTGVYVGSAQGFDIINQQVIRYIGPGDTPTLSVLGDFRSCNVPDCYSATLSGYLENCAVTGCPAPVHQ